MNCMYGTCKNHAKYLVHCRLKEDYPNHYCKISFFRLCDNHLSLYQGPLVWKVIGTFQNV